MTAINNFKQKSINDKTKFTFAPHHFNYFSADNNKTAARGWPNPVQWTPRIRGLHFAVPEHGPRRVYVRLGKWPSDCQVKVVLRFLLDFQKHRYMAL